MDILSDPEDPFPSLYRIGTEMKRENTKLVRNYFSSCAYNLIG